MKLMKLPKQIESQLPKDVRQSVSNAVSDIHWTRAVAAGSLVASAWFLITGNRKAALAIAAAGAAAVVLENPDAAKEFWKNIPGHLRTGQDFLVRAESFVEDVVKKGEKLQRAFTRS